MNKTTYIKLKKDPILASKFPPDWLSRVKTQKYIWKINKLRKLVAKNIN